VQCNYRDCSADLNDDESCAEPELSCFVRDGDEIFHTYSAYARGMEDGVPATGWT
jgi:predicted dithiol-disulfide oxidoreductase (DUF899 family)